ITGRRASKWIPANAYTQVTTVRCPSTDLHSHWRTPCLPVAGVASGRFRKSYRHGDVPFVAFTSSVLIRLDLNFDVSVSERSAVRPCLALAGQTHLLPVDDPRWDTNGNGPGTVHGALALAIITWVGNRAAGATTHSAWARECESAAVFTSKTS